jgi:DNA-directed RNA polymerase subunit H
MARKKTRKKAEKSVKKNEFDLTEHELVPKHTIITEKEEKEILKKYNIKPDRLPKILNTDPVVVSIGAKPGQIIRVERESQTARKAVAYRIVVETTN